MEHRLTPAGLQVEAALTAGYEWAAHNIYMANVRDDVAMVEGDEAGEVSVWPEWHRMIQDKLPEAETMTDEEAQEADEGSLERKMVRNEVGEVVGEAILPRESAR